VHVPLGAPGKVKGVLSLGLGGSQKDISADDHLMIRNLAAQVSVAIENAALKEDMEKTYVETVAALAAAVEARDIYTKGHSRRVTELSVALARAMGLSAQACKDIEAAALLHDIGKIGIPDSILHNAGPLPPEGLRHIHDHPIGGENILKPVGSLGRLCPIVRHHHEHYDGGGYPDRLKGDQIPLAARILAVADSYDAMISDRSYKPARSPQEAMEELRRCRWTLFDPACVDAFIANCCGNPAAAPRYPT
jgi:HD-GYP domain-containing protein (c-di-GMP phosphodiesterase class II)